ncbi:molybdenum cofactor biosynthesis protein 1-like [Schistocerca americana]|uniref:molybdenum cofactor biosynthesis protein 1-like n=1 Tax=Schistocerca americana TaxID=7009 RepID=UPI001F500F08|nr:molybdenum cofactor biosynthesis protein 1-like [Schistocerca americana]
MTFFLLFMIVIDVGHVDSKYVIQKRSDFLQKAKLCVRRIVERRIFTSGKDEIGLIVLGSDKTQTLLDYPNASVEFPLALPTWQVISFVEKSLHEREIKTDWIDGVVVGMQVLKDELDGKDEIGLIVLGSDKTQTLLDYPNASVEFPLALPTWQMISFVEKSLHEREIKTDWIDGVVVGMQVLKDELECNVALSGALKKIKDRESVLMTTDGLILTRQLVALQRAGLDGLNICLDTLQSQCYNQIMRRKGWERAMAGIDLALQLEYDPVKINCVVMQSFNEDEVCSFVELTKEKNVDVRFIEYMPFSGNKWNDGKMVSFCEMLQIIRKQWPNFDPLPNGPNDTSKAYHVPGFKGRVGFITSMSEHFCGTCNRLPITADGNLKVCLFGNSEISLRDAIRSKCSEDDLLAMIGAAVRRKKKQHAGMLNLSKMKNRPMILIGG